MFVNMNLKNTLLNDIINTIISIKRKIYSSIKRIKLKNDKISIISNNCLAGVIYHDLGMRFLSPTINLFFETDEDYLEYLFHMDYYLTNEPVEKKDARFSWPVGEIHNRTSTITIHFMHYKSFCEAREKWIERGNRIDKSRVFVFWLVGNESGPSVENFRRFKQLPFCNKLLITGKGFGVDDKEVLKLGFINKDSTPGQWAKYKSKFSSKRYIDECDYIHCFNNMIID